MSSKKLFFGLPFLMMMAVLFLGIISCGGNDEDIPQTVKPETPKETKYSPVGVWEKGKYFISFNDDNFCSAYFVDDYVDCGTYSVNDNNIICSNAYYAKQTKYNIIKLTDNTLEVKIDYTSMSGEALSKSMTFTKSTEKVPSVKDHSLVGKTLSSLVYFDGYNTSTWSFETYNTGTHSVKSGAASKYPLKVYYAFFDNKIYYQTFKTTQQMPSIGGWSASTTVTISKVSFSSDGSISSITKIEE